MQAARDTLYLVPKDRLVRIPENLLNQAADLIEENADSLRMTHSIDGKWVTSDPEDIRAIEQYVREKRLVKLLRSYA